MICVAIYLGIGVAIATPKGFTQDALISVEADFSFIPVLTSTRQSLCDDCPQNGKDCAKATLD